MVVVWRSIFWKPLRLKLSSCILKKKIDDYAPAQGTCALTLSASHLVVNGNSMPTTAAEHDTVHDYTTGGMA